MNGILQMLLIITLSTNAIILIFFYYFYLSQRRFLDSRPFFREIDRLRSQVVTMEKRLLKEALEKSTASVRHSLEAFKELEELTEETKLSLEKKAEELVQESISKHSEVFQKVMNDISDSYKKQLEYLINLQNTEYTKMLSSVKVSAQEEIRKLKEQTWKAAQEEKIKAEGEMRVYKDKITADLNKRIVLIISQVARETVGQGFAADKHEKLVMQALERAKEEKLF